jgi:uncharacterized protein (TIGR02147 family)
MNIYAYIDYRDVLTHFVQERRNLGNKITFQQLAESALVQKSYLSQVMAKRAELSSDQLFLLCEFCCFSEEEVEYLYLLLEYSRCSIKKRKELLKNRIEKIRAKHRETDKHIESRSIKKDFADEFYLDSWNQLIHVCLSIEKYRNNPNLLANDLQITQSRLIEILDRLMRFEIIKWHNNKIEVLINNLHLNKNSPVYSAWKNQVRIMSMSRTQAMPVADAYNFAVLFSATEETKNFVHEQFLKFLQAVQPNVKDAPAENVFQMNFDLFKWL